MQEILRDGLGQRAVRVLVGAVVAGIAWWLCCLFNAHSESGTVFLIVLGGTCGGCVGTFSQNWKVGRLVSNAIAGIFLSLILYYLVRGFIIRAAAPPSIVRACGVAAASFLASMSRTSRETWSGMNLVARRAVVLLAFGLAIRGIILLCR
jgi:hypothetical protein